MDATTTSAPTRLRHWRAILALAVLGMCVVVAVFVFELGAAKKAQRYETLDDLYAAYIEAGGTCDSWEVLADEDVMAEFGVGAGTCGEIADVVLMVSSKATDRSEFTRETHAPTLVGPNWTIISDAEVLDAVEPKLGGVRNDPPGGEE